MNNKRLYFIVMHIIRQICYLLVMSLSFLLLFFGRDVLAESYEYDELDRVSKVIYEDGSYTSYQYDQNGNMVHAVYHENEEPEQPEDSGGNGGEKDPSGGNGGEKDPSGGNGGEKDPSGGNGGEKDPSGGNGSESNPSGGQGGSASVSGEEKNNSAQTGQQGTNTQSGITNHTTATSGEKETTAKSHKVGMKATSQNAVYVITSVKKKTVTFLKLNASKKSYTIPSYVKIDHIKYKVTKINAKAFKNQKKLKKVVLGAYISSIGKEAFRGCVNLKDITIKSTRLTSVGKNAFYSIHKKAKIKVPKKKYTKYKKLLAGKGQKKTVKILKR